LITVLRQTSAHYPEQPNPAQPYIDFAQNFASGGLRLVFGWAENAVSRAL
jgi:hypothetical protein